MNWYLQAFKNYANFSGRARRKEYWMFALFNVLFSIIVTVLDFVLSPNFIFLSYGFFTLVYGLVVMIPNLSISVRRLHDIGNSGFWMLIAIIPIIGAIWLFVLFITDSAHGENQYGANPKEIVF